MRNPPSHQMGTGQSLDVINTGRQYSAPEPRVGRRIADHVYAKVQHEAAVLPPMHRRQVSYVMGKHRPEAKVLCVVDFEADQPNRGPGPLFQFGAELCRHVGKLLIEFCCWDKVDILVLWDRRHDFCKHRERSTVR